MIEDMITFLVMLGFPVEWVMDLDFLSFRAVWESANRVHHGQSTRNAWTAMVAAQGSHREMKDWQETWMAPASREAKEGDDSGKKRFLAAHGRKV